MPTVALNRNGTTAIVDEKPVTGANIGNPRQWVVSLGADFPVLGAGNVDDYIGEFVGALQWGENLEYEAEFDWLNGGVLLVTSTRVRVSARRDDADGASPLEIDVTADIQEEQRSSTVTARPFVRPQRTLSLAATGQGGTEPVGTLPKFAAQIIGVSALLVGTAELSLQLTRNDDTTIVLQRQFATAAAFSSLEITQGIMIPADATRVIAEDTVGAAGDDVQNIRVIFELALP